MKATDNSHFEEKVALRIEALSHSANDNVLDCFSGTGRIWKEVQRRTGRSLNIVQIEKEKGKNKTAMCGDNLKILPSLDLSKFGLIDLDAYGHPSRQMKLIAERGFDGVVVVTWIDTMMSKQPKDVVRAAGLDVEFYFKHSVIFNYLNDKLLQNFLYICGVKKARGFFFDGEANSKKKYFYYTTNKKNQNHVQNL